MGWFDDAVGTVSSAVSNPIGLVAGQLGGSKVKGMWDKFNPMASGIEGLQGRALGLDQQGVEDQGSPIPDYTDKWSKISQDLNTNKLQDANETLQGNSAAALADASSNLAMKGGLSAGSQERLAKDNMSGFQNAYAGLATKYGLGASEIDKQALEKKQELDIARQSGAEKSAAIRAAAPKGLLGLGLGPL